MRIAFPPAATAAITLAMAVAVLGGAVPAAASTIAYIGSDGNVWVTTPDGGDQRRVTTDGGPAVEDRYGDVSVADDGTIATSRGYVFFFLRPDGSTKTGPSLASNGGSSLSSTPLSADLSPDGGSLLYWYVYIPLTGRSHAQVAGLFPGLPGAACGNPFACHDDYRTPQWIPGTTSYAMISTLDPRAIYVASPQGAEFWLGHPERFLEGYDVSRSGYRVLFETVPPPATPEPPEPPASQLVYFENEVQPPASPDAPAQCVLEGFAEGTADPRWSPDGTQFAWAGAAGIYVSPAPVIQEDGTCAISPRLIAAGGREPDWGPADLPARPAPPGAQPPQPVVRQPAGNAAPRLSDLAVRPNAFRTKGRRGRLRAAITYTASEAAVTTFQVERARRGIRRGGACVKPRRGARGKRCRRYVPVPGSWEHASVAGSNRLRFPARVGGRALGVGRYRLLAVAEDPAGARSAQITAAFRVVARR
jgi:hypothetical protein